MREGLGDPEQNWEKLSAVFRGGTFRIVCCGLLEKALRFRGGLPRICGARVLVAGMRRRQEGFGKEGAVRQRSVCEKERQRGISASRALRLAWQKKVETTEP